MSGTARELQELVTRAGCWVDASVAERLARESSAGMPFDEVMRQVLDAARPLTQQERDKLRSAWGPACPRCGVLHPDDPCRGDPSHGSRPLPYRHAGRVPPLKGRPRLDGPALTDAGFWDTEAAYPGKAEVAAYRRGVRDGKREERERRGAAGNGGLP